MSVILYYGILSLLWAHFVLDDKRPPLLYRLVYLLSYLGLAILAYVDIKLFLDERLTDRLTKSYDLVRLCFDQSFLIVFLLAVADVLRIPVLARQEEGESRS